MLAPPARLLSRRAVILGGLGALGLAACSSNSQTSPTDPADEPGGEPAGADPSFVLAYGFPPSEFAVAGLEQRFPFLVADSEGVFLTDLAGPVNFTVKLGDEVVVEGVEVAPRSQGVPRAYVPLRFTPPEPGIYDVIGEYEGAELPANIQVVDRGDLSLVQVGDTMPGVATPTFDDHRGVEPICTRDPECALHETSLASVIEAGQPSAVLIASPAFCSTTICGPVLDLLIEEVAAGGYSAMHAEVYANPEAVDNIVDATLAPTPEAFGLTYEPALFVADNNGIVVDRLDAVFDQTEISEALAKTAG